MAKPDKSHANIAKEIAKKYGSVIDLNKSPSVILEIIRNYKYLFGADGTTGMMSTIAVGINDGTGVGGTGTGGTGSGTSGTGSGTGSGVDGTGGVSAVSGPGTSSIAVAGAQQIGDGDIYMSNAAVMKAILAMHRDVKAIAAALAAKAPAAKAPAAKAPAAKAPAAKKR
jgi:hypothetical protein